MRRVVFLVLLLSLCVAAQKGKKTASTTAPPVLLPSEEIVNEYMHHMVGYDPTITWKILSIGESDVPGMALVVLRVGEGEGRLTQLYVSVDGKHAIAGEAVPFGRDPFVSTREKLAREARGPSIGSADAPVTIVEFSDLQCPHCKAAQPVIDRLIAEVPNSRLVFQHFPLEPLHPWAFKAAAFAQCVAQRKPRAFWSYIRSVYDSQLDMTAGNATDKLKALAAAAGVDGNEVANCSQTEAAKAAIRTSQELGRSLRVEATPTLFINGRKIGNMSAIPYESLKKLVDFEASEAEKNRTATPPPSDD